MSIEEKKTEKLVEWTKEEAQQEFERHIWKENQKNPFNIQKKPKYKVGQKVVVNIVDPEEGWKTSRKSLIIDDYASGLYLTHEDVNDNSYVPSIFREDKLQSLN